MTDQPQVHSSVAPRVSVIIPAYNAAKYIAEALDSVLDQTLTSHEIIVINDGSPDTAELERALGPYRGRIQYLKQDNQGAAAARNTGLRAARGEFVAFLDADDTWSPNFLEEQLAFIKRSNANLVYADAVLVGQSPLAGRTFMQLQPSRGTVTPESLLAVKVTVLTSTVLASKKHIFDVGLFDERLKRAHDFELWLRLARAGVRFAYQRKMLAHHRIIESSLSGSTISQLERTLTVLEAIRNQSKLSNSENGALQLSVNRAQAQLAIEKGKEKLLVSDYAGATRHFNEARALEDSLKLKAVCLGLRIAPGALRRFQRRRVTATNRPQ